MSMITSFRELNVYRRAREEARRVFDESRHFPRDEQYSLTSQIRRSSRAVGAMVGEAWARRRYEAVFVNKISEALGEATETQAWLDHAVDCGYISARRHAELDAVWGEIGAMLQSVIDKAPAFCRTQARRR